MHNHPCPLFSITIPTYNRAHLLPRAITSVLEQTFSNFELILVDDGSTDNTEEVVKCFADPRIQYLYQSNAGGGTARNTGARHATGKYITFLDSDDDAAPTWLEQYSRTFEETSADVICCGFERIRYGHRDGKERIVFPRSMGPLFDNQVGLFTHGGTFALRSEIFKEVGGYASGLSSGQHSELAMRLIPLCHARGWKIHNMNVPLIRYHMHAGARIRRDPCAIYRGAQYILEHHQDLLQKAPKRHAHYLAIVGVNAARLGKYGEAKQFLARSIAADPWGWKNYGRLLLALSSSVGQRFWDAGNDDTSV
ncbi:MAG: glycosyltransferase family 2 protein [Caldilineaceae bacterium]|nr:glycosyltransferase family 2 protein [Caldilineaceae bacterium]